MKLNTFSRRKMLKATAFLGTASFIGLSRADSFPLLTKTPGLTPEEIKAIETALGKKGNYVADESVHTTPLPRNDLKITVKGETVPISFGFGGWVAFKKSVDGKSAMVMSDTVLLQEEVNPLITAAHVNGLEISAIHNHFFYEEPRIFYMHIHGMGSVEELAKKFSATIKDAKIFPANQPVTNASQTEDANKNFDIPALDAIVQSKGTVNGATYKYTIGRDDLKIMGMGVELTKSIGLNSWASFAGTKENAHIAGDIAMLEAEVNPVIKVLRQQNIEVVALHNHMLGDDPRMIFLHYYAKGPASQLAKGFKAALDTLGKSIEKNKMKH